jgi:hypothetical protein
MRSHLKQKKARRLAGGQSMIVWLVDQSRHRAATVRLRHQKRAIERAAMAFRCVIDSPITLVAKARSTALIG